MFHNPLALPVLLALGAGIVFLSWRYQPKNTKLDWPTLATLFRNEEDIVRVRLMSTPGAGNSADFGIMLQTELESVKYYRSHRSTYFKVPSGEDRLVETIDVYRRGEFGFIATFANEHCIAFDRVGGTKRDNPNFLPEVETVLKALLLRIRALADKKASSAT